MGSEAGALGDIFLAAQGVNAAAGAANTYQQVQAQRAAGRHEKQAAYDEAAMMDLQAKDVERNAERSDALRGLRTREMIAKQRAAAAGQGIDVDSANVEAMSADAAMFAAMDSETERNNAWRTVFGIKSEAANTRTSGRNAKASAKHSARLTAATGGLQFGRDAVEGAYKYDQFRKKKG